ncbi:MAG TPA: hypothetical protein DCY26_10420 [Hyphomonas sp.]|nr:hypothetical protein [Hyphomonas sp.]
MLVFIIESVDFDPRRDFLSSTSAGPDRRSFAARLSARTPAAQWYKTRIPRSFPCQYSGQRKGRILANPIGQDKRVGATPWVAPCLHNDFSAPVARRWGVRILRDLLHLRKRPYTTNCIMMRPLARSCTASPTLQLGRHRPRRHIGSRCRSPPHDTQKNPFQSSSENGLSNTLPRCPMKPRVNLRLNAALLAQLEAAARAQKTTKTDILEQALRCYLDPDRNRSLEARLMERMDAFEKRLGQLFWAVDLGVETTGHFVLYWLTRTDPIPESERDIAHALGERRFDHFINQIAKKLRRRRSLVAESLRWEQSEPEEAKPR